ncbi:DsbA family protein [Pontibacillus salicampi]|uniref:DsbA family protein n=1 Tax=Pontibacillus salicampi TaxID=1449801 RepID=A0ABV6LQ82_9BACI
MAATNQKSSNKWIFWMIGIIALGVVLIVVLDNQFSQGSEEEESAAADISYENQPYLGEEDAPVNIIEFGDYKCPACKNFQDAAFPQIKQEFVDTGKAKFYFINFPFINVDSDRSAKFAEVVYRELGNDIFWKFHETLYENQPPAEDEHKDIYKKDFLKETLQSVVEDESKVEQVMTAFEETSDDIISTDKEIAQSLNVSVTPTIAVNGKVFEGETFEDLKNRVEEASKENSQEEE